MLKSQRGLVIDEEGFFSMEERRIQDEEIGAHLLESLVRKERGSFTCFWENEEIAVEAFDEPLVVQSLDVLNEALIKQAGDQVEPTVKVTFPYNVKVPLIFESLSLDEWDRFHGRTAQGIPYVFSRKAQAQFFEFLDSFEDDSITWQGREYPIRPWLSARPDLSQAAFWSNLYQESQDGWELNAPAPALVDMLPRLKLPRSRILILGAGRGNDAAFFAESGHIVTAVDLSPEAVREGQERYKHLPIQWQQKDLFHLPREWEGQFDMVFEHTCYCAIDPARRSELVKIWNRMLTPQGQLMGVFFVMDRPQGPPFGGTEWELRERLKKFYQFQFWGRWKQSVPKRQGTELFVLGTRK